MKNTHLKYSAKVKRIFMFPNKMYRCFLLIILTAFLNNISFCQTEEVLHPKNKLWVGGNTVSLLQTILDNKNDSTSSPYQLHASYRFKNFGVRVGFGGNRKKTVNQLEGFQDSETNENNNINLRAGFDYIIGLGSNFNALVGIDGVYQKYQKRQLIDSGIDVVERFLDYKEYGAGPVLGMSYDFSNRVSIYTEMSFYYTIGNSVSSTRYFNYPELDDASKKIKSTKWSLNTPSSLFLIFKF